MVEKVEITDPFKVDPSLQGKSKKQLVMERDLRDMAIEILDKEEKREQVAHIVVKANEHIAGILAGFRFLDEHKLLGDEAKAAFTNPAGVFAPHLRFKPVDADRVLARMADAAPKKVRKPRKKA